MISPLEAYEFVYTKSEISHVTSLRAYIVAGDMGGSVSGMPVFTGTLHLDYFVIMLSFSITPCKLIRQMANSTVMRLMQFSVWRCAGKSRKRQVDMAAPFV